MQLHGTFVAVSNDSSDDHVEYYYYCIDIVCCLCSPVAQFHLLHFKSHMSVMMVVMIL